MTEAIGGRCDGIAKRGRAEKKRASHTDSSRTAKHAKQAKAGSRSRYDVMQASIETASRQPVRAAVRGQSRSAIAQSEKPQGKLVAKPMWKYIPAALKIQSIQCVHVCTKKAAPARDCAGENPVKESEPFSPPENTESMPH